MVSIKNRIISENGKKRELIDSLRKERTIYDVIFKEIEQNILNQEKNFLNVLEKSRENEANLKKLNDYLNKDR